MKNIIFNKNIFCLQLFQQLAPNLDPRTYWENLREDLEVQFSNDVSKYSILLGKKYEVNNKILYNSLIYLCKFMIEIMCQLDMCLLQKENERCSGVLMVVGA